MNAIVAEEGRLRAEAWATDQLHTIYFEPPDQSLDASHPRTFEVRSAKKAIAYDLIEEGSPIRVLYESAEMTSFVAAVLGKQTLHRSADPLDALEIAVFEDDDELGWHFDRSEFSVTVMFQQGDAGGHFEYFPALRSDSDANEAGVRSALHDAGTAPIRLATSPGTLAVFCGRHALHRVTKVEGSTPRINAVLTYGEAPGMKLNELTQRLFYGRTA